LIHHLKKKVKSHVFLKSEKKHKIRILEHWITALEFLLHFVFPDDDIVDTSGAVSTVADYYSEIADKE